MSELRLDLRLRPVAITAGLICGLAIGMWVGWIVWPVQIANVDATDLKPSAQDDLITLIADTYAYDKDLDRAKARLVELKDKKINERVTALAKTYATKDNPSAPNLAALAIALGARDQEIALIATTATPTATQTLPPTETPPPTLTPPATPTITPSPTITPTRTSTRRPVATATPKPAPLAPTIWIPPSSAWPSVKYEPVTVTPGQQYWHLAKAMFCDLNDKHDYCQDLPGGGTGTSTYIMLINANGARTSAPLIVTKPDGRTVTADEIGVEKSADDMCNCNYSFLSSGWLIQVGGAPSDKISGLALPVNYHVRYFLTFQLVTR